MLGLCNMLPNSKIYVMEPKGFMGYFERGSHHKLNGPQFGNNSCVILFFIGSYKINMDVTHLLVLFEH